MRRVYTPIFENSAPPGDIFFGHEEFLPNSSTPLHNHPWGQLQFIRGGILELEVAGHRYLTPSQYAVWVPPGVNHASFMRRSLSYCSMNMVQARIGNMPASPCLLEVSALMAAIVDELKEKKISVAGSPQDKRLVDVLFDQVVAAKTQTQYLPVSDDKLLSPILQELERNPTNGLSLSEWAIEVHATERTLARHCQQELGMSFTEWRSRIRFVHSLALLKKGKSIKDIALTLGYHQATPFITLFKKHAGCTPEQYRNQHGLEKR